MNAELKETLELARAVDQVITFSEHHLPSLPVTRAAKRIREGVIGALRLACDELATAWPKSDPKEVARFVESLEHGEIPKAEAAPVSIKLLDQEITKLEKKIAVRKGKLATAA